MFKTVIFALTVLGLCLGSPVRADEAEDTAVEFVQKLGGKVTRDEKAPGKPVTTLDLSFTEVTDAGLKELAPLKNLTTLDLGYTKVTNAGLKELAPLKNLTKLYLNRTRVTDAGLNELGPLKNLTTLSLYDTKVTNAGVAELQKALPNCTISK